MIVSTISQCKQWDKYIHEIAFALRTSINDSTKFTPCYINTGREFRNPLDNSLGMNSSCKESVHEFENRLFNIYSFVKANLINSQEKYLASYNKNRKRVVFDIGDLVWRKTHELSDKSKKITASLWPKYDGPFKIVNKIKTDTYELARTDNRETKTYRVHVNDLKPYFIFPILDNQDDEGTGLCGAEGEKCKEGGKEPNEGNGIQS